MVHQFDSASDTMCEVEDLLSLPEYCLCPPSPIPFSHIGIEAEQLIPCPTSTPPPPRPRHTQ